MNWNVCFPRTDALEGYGLSRAMQLSAETEPELKLTQLALWTADFIICHRHSDQQRGCPSLGAEAKYSSTTYRQSGTGD